MFWICINVQKNTAKAILTNLTGNICSERRKNETLMGKITIVKLPGSVLFHLCIPLSYNDNVY